MSIMTRKTNTILGITVLFVLGFIAVPAFADANNSNIQCKDIHVLAERSNGKLVCVKESTAERFGWTIIPTSEIIVDEIFSDQLQLDKKITIPDNVQINQTKKSIDITSQNDVFEITTENTPIKESPKQQTTDDPCSDISVLEGTEYTLVEPTTHTITGGTFEKLCVQLHYKWFNIYLDTDSGGSITLEIPKGIVNLKQYDYLDCHGDGRYNLEGTLDYQARKNFTVEQIAQTEQSRTFKFTYDGPVSEIEYFGAYGVFDGVDYSEPNNCIKEYEDNNYDPLGHLPWNEPKTEERRPCPELLDLDYTITNGNVDKICGSYPHIFVVFYFSNVTSGSELTVDIPWSNMRPYRTVDFGTEYFFADTDAGAPRCYPPRELLFRTQEYQTFKIPILPDADHVSIGHHNESRGMDELSEILDAVKPFDRSKGNFTERCPTHLIVNSNMER